MPGSAGSTPSMYPFWRAPHLAVIPIVSEKCGASALFDGSNSIRCDIDEADWADEAATSLVRLCSDNALYREVASRSHAVATANTWDAVAERYWEVLSNDE